MMNTNDTAEARGRERCFQPVVIRFLLLIRPCRFYGLTGLIFQYVGGLSPYGQSEDYTRENERHLLV